MNYLNSKIIPQDLFTVIGRFLSYETLIKLKNINNSSFSSDSQIYKEYFVEHYPFVVKYQSIENYKNELEKINKYERIVDYACAEGYQELLEQCDDIPSEESISKAYSKHRVVVEHIYKKHYSDHDAIGVIASNPDSEYGYAFIITAFCSSMILISLIMTTIYLLIQIQNFVIYIIIGLPLFFCGIPGAFIISCVIGVCASRSLAVYMNPEKASQDDIHRKLLDRLV